MENPLYGLTVEWRLMWSPCWPTYTLNFKVLTRSISLSTLQWDFERKLMSDIVFCPQQYICCLYFNLASRFTSFRRVLLACGRAE